MSKRRRRKRYYIDAGDGITLATTLRSPPDPETIAAFKALAQAAAAEFIVKRPGALTEPVRAGVDEVAPPGDRVAPVTASDNPSGSVNASLGGAAPPETDA